MGIFIIKPGFNKRYHYSLHNTDGEVLLSNGGYTTKAYCKRCVKTVQKFAQSYAHYEKIISPYSKFSFNLKSANNRVIGKGGLFDSAQVRDKAIESVIQNCQEVSIEVL